MEHRKRRKKQPQVQHRRDIVFRNPRSRSLWTKPKNLIEDGYEVFVFFPSQAEREKFLKLTENLPRDRAWYT